MLFYIVDKQGFFVIDTDEKRKTVVERTGFEPVTSALPAQRSTN